MFTETCHKEDVNSFLKTAFSLSSLRRTLFVLIEVIKSNRGLYSLCLRRQRLHHEKSNLYGVIKNVLDLYGMQVEKNMQSIKYPKDEISHGFSGNI